MTDNEYLIKELPLAYDLETKPVLKGNQACIEAAEFVQQEIGGTERCSFDYTE